jgi:hypothetical protein
MVERLKDFYEVNVKDPIRLYCTEMKEFVLDTYVDVSPKHKVWLIDINPWLPESTESLLFDWDELTTNA